jgi:hypothetical protein
MRILKLILTFVAASTIAAQRWLQDSPPREVLIKGIKIKKMVHCNQFLNECKNLNPHATGCLWAAEAFVGQCVYIDEEGVIQNTFETKKD